eukprot:CAMPEP_0183726972 /NCGR_PEP_ID=MMETSP0737-20130205/24467_1 /TAXON_ID=385413 /ORGANISM="Thalassiosira miniscula, Strain CCMP1093" /LENGTH=73 /DNA_ID=CAMNT_0025958467 /DNA_START=261 /DNA_END=482 /DNA_ORIENTATION=+
MTATSQSLSTPIDPTQEAGPTMHRAATQERNTPRERHSTTRIRGAVQIDGQQSSDYGIQRVPGAPGQRVVPAS